MCIRKKRLGIVGVFVLAVALAATARAADAIRPVSIRRLKDLV
ncbi:MAG: hypothetical protein AB2448_10175 [Moorella sp. (in: firmicutes)]